MLDFYQKILNDTWRQVLTLLSRVLGPELDALLPSESDMPYKKDIFNLVSRHMLRPLLPPLPTSMMKNSFIQFCY